MGEPKIQEITFQKVILEGTAYEVGKTQGEWIQKDSNAVKFFTSPLEGGCYPTLKEAEQMLKFFDHYCPGLNDEIQGFADALCTPVEHIVYYPFSYSPGNPGCRGSNCSHIALLPSATSDGHIYVGRSYEWNLQDDFRLCTTRIHGKAAHLGFSLLQFGRIDGINEHGLCITMSAGCPLVQPVEDGCRFWAVIRTVLDRCRSVEEALEVIRSIPISFHLNLLLTDKHGESALIEIFSSKRAVKRIGPNTKEQTLWSTNHYNLPEMIAYDQGRMWMSVIRYQKIASVIKNPSAPISKEQLRELLSKPVPEGLCCHYYHDGFGTLWSEIFDLTTGSVEICFGSPAVNKWHTFDLSGLPGLQAYTVKFSLETPAHPEQFFKKMAPGVEE
jgi:predicted choloylglycine hydrolase